MRGVAKRKGEVDLNLRHEGRVGSAMGVGRSGTILKTVMLRKINRRRKGESRMRRM